MLWSFELVIRIFVLVFGVVVMLFGFLGDLLL